MQTSVAAVILICNIQVSPGKLGDKAVFTLKVKSGQRFQAAWKNVNLLAMGKSRLP